MSEEKSCACAHVKSQNVTDAPGNNTVFMIWRFGAAKAACKKAFERLCALVINLNKTAVTRFGAASETSCVLGVGFEAWKMLGLPKPLPKELKNFEEIRGDKHIGPATGGDIHIHIRAANQAVCYDMASEIRAALKDVATCEEEICGFKYYDGRAIIGFVDGTENPAGKEAISNFGLNEHGGSYVLIQRYLHNLAKWDAYTVAQQEESIGRSKESNEEFPKTERLPTSHLARTNIKENGKGLKIIRRSLPYGTASGEHGLAFIAYAGTLYNIEIQLQHMFGDSEDGLTDLLLERISTAISGAYYYAPSVERLQDL